MRRLTFLGWRSHGGTEQGMCASGAQLAFDVKAVAGRPGE